MNDLDRLQELLNTRSGGIKDSPPTVQQDVTRQEQADVPDDSASSDEAYSIAQVMDGLSALVYPGEFVDRQLLEERYNLNTYLNAIAHKKHYARESISQQAMNASVCILPQFMPHIYDIAQSVLSNLKIDFNEIADGGIEVRLLSAADRNLLVNVTQTENGLVFSFIIDRAFLSGYTDAEIAYFWGIRLYEALFDTQRYCSLITLDEDDNPHALLPKYAELIRKRMYFESLVSMDRIGLLACRDLVAAQTALIKVRHNGELGDKWLHIPDNDELEKLAQSGMYNLNAHHEMSVWDFIPIRLRCMRMFWSEYLADPNDKTKDKVDLYVSKCFENFMPTPMSEEEELAANLVASVGMEMIVRDGQAKDDEIRVVMNELLDFVTPPSCAINTDILKCAQLKRSAIQTFKGDGPSIKIIADKLARIAINSGERFEANNKMLIKVLGQLGWEAVWAQYYLTDTYKQDGWKVDPLMDDLVACARARLEGTTEPPARQRLSAAKDFREMSLTQKIRYSGDLEAVEKLGNVYHLNAMIQQSETVQEHLATSDLHEEYLYHLHLTPEISPRVCSIVERVRKALGYTDPLEVFCENPLGERPRLLINACAWIDVAKDGRTGIINITPEALEVLDDDELAYLIGHEIGHLIYRHGQWGFVVKSKDDRTTMLPFMGNRLYWEWKQKCEISADRAGAVAAGNAEAALRAQLKVCYGLSPKNLDVNADVLLSQLKVVQEAEELEWSARAIKEHSHPIDPLRINALKAFCDVFYARGCGASGLKPQHLEKVDKKIAESYELLRRYPRTEDHKAAMKFVALYGLKIINSDDVIEDRELAELLEILMSEHTDRPVDELIGDPKARDKAITAAAEVLADSDDEDLKRFTMLQLAYLALVDGTISNEDRDILCNVAGLIDLGEFDVDSMLQNAAEMQDFPVDFLLEDEIKKVKKMLEDARQ